MKEIVAIIEKASDGGYGIYCPELQEVPALFGHGMTEQEAKENLHENLEAAIEHFEEQGVEVPAFLTGKVEFDYRYDFSGFFKTYSCFNVSELATMIGINSSLLRKYKKGLAYASGEQRKKIETGVHLLAQRLSAVQF